MERDRAQGGLAAQGKARPAPCRFPFGPAPVQSLKALASPAVERHFIETPIPAMQSDAELTELAAELESDRVERKASVTDRSRVRQAICPFQRLAQSPTTRHGLCRRA